jgi:hypothetical protein
MRESRKVQVKTQRRLFLENAFWKNSGVGLGIGGSRVACFENVRPGGFFPVRFFGMKESLESFQPYPQGVGSVSSKKRNKADKVWGSGGGRGVSQVFSK